MERSRIHVSQDAELALLRKRENLLKTENNKLKIDIEKYGAVKYFLYTLSLNNILNIIYLFKCECFLLQEFKRSWKDIYSTIGIRQ